MSEEIDRLEKKYLEAFEACDAKKHDSAALYQVAQSAMLDWYNKSQSKNRVACNDLFFRIEKHCHLRDIFWVMAASFWQSAGVADKRWVEAWNRYDRRDLHINKRIKLFGSHLDKDDGKYIENYLQVRGGKVGITAYRGFTARVGKRIRGGEVKVDTGYYIQEEGAGFSYSLSKQVAINHTRSFVNDVILEKYADADDDDVERIKKLLLGTDAKSRNFSEATFFGKYKIEKRDIIGAFMTSMGEQEIVAEKAHLERYEVITAELAMTATIMELLRRSLGWHTMLHGIEEERLFGALQKGVQAVMKEMSYREILDSCLKGGSEVLIRALEKAGLASKVFSVSANGMIQISSSVKNDNSGLRILSQ